MSKTTKKADTGEDTSLYYSDDGQVFSSLDGAPSSNLGTMRDQHYIDTTDNLRVNPTQGRAHARNQAPRASLRLGDDDDMAGTEAPPRKPRHYKTARLRHQDPPGVYATHGGDTAPNLYVASRQGEAKSPPGWDRKPPPVSTTKRHDDVKGPRPVFKPRRGQDDTAGAEAPFNKPRHYQATRLHHQEAIIGAQAVPGDEDVKHKEATIQSPNRHVTSNSHDIEKGQSGWNQNPSPVSTPSRSHDDTIGAEAPPNQPRLYHRVIGALAIPGVDYSPEDDDRTVQIGGDESVPPRVPSVTRITTPAQVVDAEEELRIRRENEMFHHMFEDVAVAQAVATPEHETEQESVKCLHCTKKRLLISSGLLLLLAAVAVGIIFGLGVSGETAPSSVEPTQTTATPPASTTAPTPPPPTPPQDLIDFLSSVSSDGGVALLTPGSPQNKALDWLAGNWNLDSYSNDKKRQRYALAVIYFSTEGDTWFKRENWVDDFEECGRWWQNVIFGPSTIRCTDSGSALELNLNTNNLQGILPPEIELLTDSLEILFLCCSLISGPIPSEIGQLSNLVSLWLDWNHLTGSIPSELGLLTKLTSVEFDSNKLNGTIPASLESLTNLESLSLDNNKLSGTIPSLFGSLTNLEILELFDNNFSGNFTCPDFITTCYISCEDDTEECRSL